MNPRLVKLTIAWFALLFVALCMNVNGPAAHSAGMTPAASTERNPMLVISRFQDESIVISRKSDLSVVARISVERIAGGKVRLGVVAADDLFIDRNEVYSQRVGEAAEEKKASDAK